MVAVALVELNPARAAPVASLATVTEASVSCVVPTAPALRADPGILVSEAPEPLKAVAVTVPAAKFPLASRYTTELAVLVEAVATYWARVVQADAPVLT